VIVIIVKNVGVQISQNGVVVRWESLVQQSLIGVRYRALFTPSPRHNCSTG